MFRSTSPCTTFGTPLRALATSAGVNVRAVQWMLGRASAAMTLDTYADLFDDDLDAVVIALEKAIADSLAVEKQSEDDSESA